MCPAQGHKAVITVRFEPASPRSRVKHSITEQLSSILKGVKMATKYYIERVIIIMFILRNRPSQNMANGKQLSFILR